MFDSDDWVQQHRNRIRELEAALAKVTAERDEAIKGQWGQLWDCERKRGEAQAAALKAEVERDEAVRLLAWTRSHADWTNKDYKSWLRERDALLDRIDAKDGSGSLLTEGCQCKKCQ